MKRHKARSLQEMLEAPEGEWYELKEGFQVEVIDDTSAAKGRRLVLPITPATARRLKPRKGERLDARIAGGELIIERTRPPRARRSRPQT